MIFPGGLLARRARWACLCAVSLIAPGAWADLVSTTPEPGAVSVLAADRSACLALIPLPWPSTLVERRLHLRRLEAARTTCITVPQFLAALGALLLEEGDPDQARVWLERSLMLEPNGLGAQADHALALAALGEPTALRELTSAWRDRSDVPPALWRRMAEAVASRRDYRLPLGSLGQPPLRRTMASRGEASLTLGFESNLAVSPRLTELTLTPKDEPPVTLPVVSAPRRGPSVRADLSWQAAWELAPQRIVRTSLGLSGRSAPGHSDTDWHQFTAAVSFARQAAGWGVVGQLDAVWFGGALTEPYALARGRLSLELSHETCDQQWQVEVQERRQTQTETADSTTTLIALRLRCRPPGTRDWSIGGFMRRGVDVPRVSGRPGGTQHSEAAGLSIGYRPNGLSSVELNLGLVRLVDREGYSQLLENNAVRRQKQSYLMVEGSHALGLAWMPGAEFVVQATRFRQTSNLALFRHDGYSVYAGLRWPW